jgi:hypothetical protein
MKYIQSKQVSSTYQQLEKSERRDQNKTYSLGKLMYRAGLLDGGDY